MKRIFAVIILIWVAGCTQFPQLDAVEGPDVRFAPFPRLLPIDSLIDAPPARVSRDLETPILARAAALRARAKRIARRPVIDAKTRTRMSRGVTGQGSR